MKTPAWLRMVAATVLAMGALSPPQSLAQVPGRFYWKTLSGASATDDIQVELLQIRQAHPRIFITPEKLVQLQRELEDDSGDIKLESGFGIGNVNKRIRLYYGKPYGVTVRSEYNSGTCVTLIIPAKTETMPEVEEPASSQEKRRDE